MHVALVVKQEFRVVNVPANFNKEYLKDAEIDPKETAYWPKGAMANRLKGGDIEWENRGLPEQEPTEPRVPKTEKELTALNKDQLVAYAMDTHGVELDVAAAKAELVKTILALETE